MIFRRPSSTIRTPARRRSSSSAAVTGKRTLSADAPVYLDASAVVKLVLREPGSEALALFLRSRRRRFSSALLLAEVPRAVRRATGPRAEEHEQRLVAAMASLTLVSSRPRLLRLAAMLEPASMRALDAIHVATALRLSRRVRVFVSYDRRQLAAARRMGLTTVSPGAEA